MFARMITSWSALVAIVCLRSNAARMTPLAVVLILTAITGDAAAQSRRRFQEPPPPPPQALPTISSEAGRCSFAFHDALVRINSGSVRELMMFDSLARVPEPGLTGRWLFWAKSGKGGKAATTEQVCAETATKSGRERCVRWETRRIEAAIAGAQPTAEELAALRALDGFVDRPGGTAGVRLERPPVRGAAASRGGDRQLRCAVAPPRAV